jgi:TonB-dependent starch-binding outer membrane protein SusC
MKKSRLFKVTTLLVPLLLFSLWSFGQALSVRGTVNDATGAPIPGVTVVVKGTSQGTITDIDGNYSLREVNNNGVLVFSFVGMTTQEIAIGGRTEIPVVLSPDYTDLEEVVVVGYGVQRKEAVTGSVVSMSGDALRDIPSSNITQALQGRMAGVEMAQTSSRPGASMQIRIRGTRSLTASNDPLIVLDGVPFVGTIGDISTNDIKSLSIY